MIVTLKALKRLGMDPASTRVVIQGFGNVGGMAARLMSRAGFKVVSIVEYDAAVYNVISYDPDLQAYRTDRFTGYVRQPAGVGPVLFSNTSPSYALLTPVAASGDGGGGVSPGLIAGIVAAVAIIGGIVWLVLRRRSADERE